MPTACDRQCPKCGGPLATDGRREWCPAVVPEAAGEPCGYRLRGGLDAPDLWRPELASLMARIRATDGQAKKRRTAATLARRTPAWWRKASS